MRLHSRWFRPGINADVLRSIRRGRVGNQGDRKGRSTGCSSRGRWGPGGRLVDAYYDQLHTRNAVILASIIDKRQLRADTTHEVMHRIRSRSSS